MQEWSQTLRPSELLSDPHGWTVGEAFGQSRPMKRYLERLLTKGFRVCIMNTVLDDGEISKVDVSKSDWLEKLKSMRAIIIKNTVE